MNEHASEVMGKNVDKYASVGECCYHGSICTKFEQNVNSSMLHVTFTCAASHIKHKQKPTMYKGNSQGLTLRLTK